MADTEEKTIITIDENARTLSCKDKVLIGVESDYEAKRLYFVAPKFIWMDQKIDLSSPDVKIYVKYKNAYSEPYYIECTDKKVDETDTSKITFSWLIGDTATLRKGNVAFSVWFRKGTLETNSEGVKELKNVTNEWHTTTITGEVLAGIDTSTTTEEIIQDKTASIYALYERIYATEGSFTTAAQAAKDDINKYKTDAETAAQAAQINAQTAAQKANNAKTEALTAISSAETDALNSISANVNEVRTAKTEAVAAKTAAETAKTAAETAKADAERAKTAVENMKYYSIEYDANTYTLTITYNNGTTTS